MAEKKRVFTYRTKMPVSAECLWDWHMTPGSFEKLSPWWQPIQLVKREEITKGNKWVMRLWMGPVPVKWVAMFDSVNPKDLFSDLQTKGPFHHWHHVHRMIPIDDQSSYLEDEVTYQTYNLLMPFMPRILTMMFKARHKTTLHDIASTKL